LQGLLEIVGLGVMAESIEAGTLSEGWMERVPDSRSCNAETAEPDEVCTDGITAYFLCHRV